jgi:carboxymethylenebutenolidase
VIRIRANDGGEFGAYVALPQSGRGPGIVLLQEIFGVNRYMREVANWYAHRGFVVACPDLFWRQEPGVEIDGQSESDWQRAFALYQGLDQYKAVEDAAATMSSLRRHSACDGPVGAVGFCLGGKLAYLLAVRESPDAAIGYYGVGIEEALDEAPNLACPLLLHIAGQDQYCPSLAQEMIHNALDGNLLVTIHDYPGQDHAFARTGGDHFDQAAAEIANLRSFEFFARNLMLAGIATRRQRLSELWEEHVKYEFETRDTERTLETMVDDAYVNHIPVLTGGVGKDRLREFYSKRFIPQMPPDTKITPVSRTVGDDRIVDEMLFEFTHTIPMDWMLPGVAPTDKHVRVPLVAIVNFREGKLAHEHIYWDQASVLVQTGLLGRVGLPVAGAESAAKVMDPGQPSNELMERSGPPRD